MKSKAVCPPELLGKRGVVTLVCEKRYCTDNRVTDKRIKTRQITPRGGVVVGQRTIKEGKMRRDYAGEDPYFDATLHKTVLLVVFWPTLKPVYVPVEGFRQDDKAKLCSPAKEAFDRQIRADEHGLRLFRTEMKIVAQNSPRNAKGQFIKQTDEEKRAIYRALDANAQKMLAEKRGKLTE